MTHIAEKLGRPFEPVWTLSYFGKRSVRTTLLDRNCDAYIGLPEIKDFMGPRVVFSHPILQVGYVLVLPKTRTVSALSDLKGLRVAVPFGSPPLPSPSRARSRCPRHCSPREWLQRCWCGRGGCGPAEDRGRARGQGRRNLNAVFSLRGS
ncbi:MAG: hypothetical protein JO157_18660 [Acetobacteraceae bacterium]|nr:hypothetical protein [Acetobacteraceae bacterium]